jgi:arylsulfatase A-like enzyme
MPLTRRAFLRRACGHAALAAPALLPRLTEAKDASKKPNIVFVLADDLGWAELGCYGSEFNETPHLDRLADEGVRFTDAYAAAPVCSPMRASFLTGQYPARVGITDYLRPNDENYLSTDHVTVAEMLGRAGYRCGVIGKWHLNGDYSRRRGMPGQHGFHEVICSERSGIGGGDYFAPYRHLPHVKPHTESEYLTDRLNQEAVDFITRNKDRPFFLFLSHYAVHTRLAAPKLLVEKYEKKPGAGKSKNNPVLAAMLERIDAGVGLIRQTLDRLGIADRTVVIFNSDNGGEHRVTDNGPLRGAKSQLYEGGIRVPLIVHWPGQTPRGAASAEPVSSIDFYPTFLDMAGVPPDPRQTLDGKSLAPLLTQTRDPRRKTLYWHYPLPRPHFLGGRSSGALRHGNLKLIEYYETDEVELYDLAEDIGETTDLAPKMPEKAAELRKILAAWRKEVGAEMPPSVTGLQLHLTFDEPADAKRARDKSQAKRVLNYHGTTPAEGRDGAARRFNGRDDHLALPRRDAPHVARLPVAVSAWVQPDRPDGVILAHGGDRHGYVFHLKDGRLAFSASIDWKRTTVVAPEKLPDGWVHVAGQLLPKGRIRLFVNGKRIADGRARGLLVSDPGDSLEVGADLVKPVGHYKVPNGFRGILDQVRLFVGPTPEAKLLADAPH